MMYWLGLRQNVMQTPSLVWFLIQVKVFEDGTAEKRYQGSRGYILRAAAEWVSRTLQEAFGVRHGGKKTSAVRFKLLMQVCLKIARARVVSLNLSETIPNPSRNDSEPSIGNNSGAEWYFEVQTNHCKYNLRFELKLTKCWLSLFCRYESRIASGWSMYGSRTCCKWFKGACF